MAPFIRKQYSQFQEIQDQHCFKKFGLSQMASLFILSKLSTESLYSKRDKGMFQKLNNRIGHYGILIVASACLSLVNLGEPSLWDIDEGLNAEAARAMYVSGNWVVPQFNGELRSAKPALLYWLQATAYDLFGVNEMAARLPSALAALLTALLAYELARFMFCASVGFMTGLILVSSLLFCGSAHFANPDALLHLFTVLTLLLYWRDFERGGDRWLLWTGISSGLAVLAKGPVGLILPSAVISLHLFWSGQFKRWFKPWLVGGVIVFILVAIPWYAWVAAETKGQFLREFFFKHHVQRFNEPMESHSGPFVYYLLVLCVGFAPWSMFFVPSSWHAWKSQPRSEDTQKRTIDPRYRFLFSWMIMFFLFFTAAATKLPNYILPVYVPVAIMIAHFLDRWRKGEVQPPAWMMYLSLSCLVLTGVGLIFGTLIASGRMLPGVMRGREIPTLAPWALFGGLPIVASGVLWWFWKSQAKQRLFVALGVYAVLFTGTLANWGVSQLESRKCVRTLAKVFQNEKAAGEIRVAGYDYFHPSMVFYCQRTVERIWGEPTAHEFLSYPVPVYIFIPVRDLDKIRANSPKPFRELARGFDMYKGREIALITNQVDANKGAVSGSAQSNAAKDVNP